MPLDADHDYLLQIDAQGEHWTELRQKLMYFLVTSSVAVAAFAINFYVTTVQGKSKFANHHPTSWIMVAAVLAAVLCAGAALLTVHLTHRSVARHIKCRYAKQSFEDLPKKEQERWDLILTWSSRSLFASFLFLFAEMVLLATFFYPAFTAS